MGRDNVLPRSVFAYVDAKRNTPRYNILLVGIVVFAGALVLNYEQSAELINFGAFLAFMGVNCATFKTFYLDRSPRSGKKLISDAIVPLAGLAFCFVIL